MKKNILSVFLFFSLVSFAQKKEEIELTNITFTELIHQLTQSSDSIYVLKDAFVKIDKKAKEKYALFSYRFENKPYPTDQLHIYKNIRFENVFFESAINVHQYGFLNFNFHNQVDFINVYNLYFFNCVFKDFNYENNSGNDKYSVLWLNDCELNGEFYVSGYENNKFSYNFINNKFNTNESGEYENYFVHSLMDIKIYDAEHFAFEENQINYNDATFSIQLIDVKDVLVNQNNIESRYWNLLNIKKIQELYFEKNNIISDLHFNIDNIQPNYNIQWPITSKRIIPFVYLYLNQKKIASFDNKTFDSIYENRANDDVFYKTELKIYSKFLSYFKELHNRQEANHVYITIKNIETERLKQLYKRDNNFKNFFELWVNRFLKQFSDYGTSPSKIVISSIKVILLFAFFFIFSSNSWSNFSLKTINKRIKQSLRYFTTEDSFVSSFELYNNQINETSKLKTSLTNNSKEIPKTFSVFSKFILSVQNKLIHLKLFVLQKFDIVKNKWVGLPVKKKLFADVAIFMAMLSYFSFKILSILLNSLMLSVNSFTTLGFGEIPIRGIGRYLAILEGFIGWLFLTLFSVTLISQILH